MRTIIAQAAAEERMDFGLSPERAATAEGMAGVCRHFGDGGWRSRIAGRARGRPGSY